MREQLIENNLKENLILKLKRPIKSANGKDEINEITRKKDDDISALDIEGMNLDMTPRGQLSVICSVFNCTEKQMKSLHPSDYTKCALFTMSLINIDEYDFDENKRKLVLKRPILSEDGKKEIKFITRKKDDDISAFDILDSKYTSSLTAQKNTVCNLYGLSEEQVSSLFPSDYMYLVTVVGKYSE